MVDCAILGQFWVYRKLTAYESAKSASAGSEADSESIAITTFSASDNKGAGLSNIELTLETRSYNGPEEGEQDIPTLLKSASAASPSLRTGTSSTIETVKGAVGAVSPVRECAPSINKRTTQSPIVKDSKALN